MEIMEVKCQCTKGKVSVSEQKLEENDCHCLYICVRSQEERRAELHCPALLRHGRKTGVDRQLGLLTASRTDQVIDLGEAALCFCGTEDAA